MGKKLWSFLTICMFTVSMAFAQQKVTGVVIEAETGEPVVGASVRVKGANIGAATNVEGKFTLEVPSSSSTLVVSYIGMKTKEVAVKPNVRIVLESESNNLSDVVVVAYGTQKKSSLTGSVSQIDSKVIEQHISTSATAALEGAAPGIQVNNTYGEPGSAPKIRIRGFSTLNDENDPLIVLDGAPFNGNISEINSADIETISTLKDAASCALYGSRASNGVIIITTRKGKGGSTPQVSLNINQGVFTRGIPEYDRMGATEWMETSWIALKNQRINGSTKMTPADAADYATKHLIDDYCKVNVYNADKSALFDANGKLTAQMLPNISEDTDWEDNLERTGYRQEYVLSGQASSEKSNFYASVGYLNEKGYIKTNEYERYSTRLTGNFNPYKWLKTGVSLNGVVGVQNYNSNAESSYYANPFYVARNMAPIYTIHAHNADGSYVDDGLGGHEYNFDKATLDNRNIAYEIRTDKEIKRRLALNANAYATIILPYGFDVTFKGVTDYATTNRQKFNNKNIGDGAANGGRLNSYAYQYRTLLFQQLINWNKSYGLNNISVLLGHESESYKMSYTYGMNTNQAVDGILVLSNFIKNSYFEGYDEEDKQESYIGRATYNYDEKYFGEFSWRNDKSSRFAPGHRSAPYFSVGAAWNLKKEKFLQDINFVDDLKVRAAYGQVGNKLSASYQCYMSLYEITKNGGNTALMKSQIGSPETSWETTNTIDAAVEGKLFNGLTFSVGYFNKRSKDILMKVKQPLSVGGYAHDEDAANPTIIQNVGVVENSGVEVSLAYDVIKNQDWKLTLGTEGTFIKSKIVTLPDHEDIRRNTTQLYSEGHDMFAWHTYHFEGVDQMDGRSLYTLDPDKTEAAKKAGALRTINDVDYTLDTTYGLRDFHGKATPDFYGSFKTELSYKNWNFNFLFTYSLGGKVLDYSYRSLMSTSASGANAYHVDLANSWNGVPAGMTETSANRIDPNGLPIVDFETNTYNNDVSDRWLTSANYLVLKNINISYTLPKRITSAWGINGVTVNAGAENLFTLTARKGLNPQYNFTGGNDDTYVTARVINLGVKLNF